MVKAKRGPRQLIYESKIMCKLMSGISRVAKSDLSVLLMGESGTGKNLIAEAIHERSPRANQVFHKIDCATLAENLIENELFGHESEAFTGALRRTQGRLEFGDKGTVFLDQIDCLPVHLQMKLLGVLEDGCFVRLGGSEEIQVDARLIVATNQNMNEMLQNGAFRRDLYYRISGIVFQIPPLRNRPEDIPLLLDYFLGLYQKRTGELKRINQCTMDILKKYSWQGNVRELENVLLGSCVQAEGSEIGPLHLPDGVLDNAMISGSLGRGEPKPLEEVCAKYTKTVLAHVGFNRKSACKYLGISYPTLKKYLDLID